MAKKNPPQARPDNLEDIMYDGRQKTALLKAAILGIGKMNDGGGVNGDDEAVRGAEALAEEIFQYWDRIGELPGTILHVDVPEKAQSDE